MTIAARNQTAQKKHGPDCNCNGPCMFLDRLLSGLFRLLAVMIARTIDVIERHSVTRYDVHPHSGQTAEDVRVRFELTTGSSKPRGTSRIATDFRWSTQSNTRVFPRIITNWTPNSAVFAQGKFREIDQNTLGQRAVHKLKPNKSPLRRQEASASESSTRRIGGKLYAERFSRAASLGSV